MRAELRVVCRLKGLWSSWFWRLLAEEQVVLDLQLIDLVWYQCGRICNVHYSSIVERHVKVNGRAHAFLELLLAFVIQEARGLPNVPVICFLLMPRELLVAQMVISACC